MRILVSGMNGAMGREVARLALAGRHGAVLAGGVSPHGCAAFGVPCAAGFDEAVRSVDCVIDFSHRSMTYALLRYVKENCLPLVLGTTGQTESEHAAILAAAAEVPLFLSANLSQGVALLLELVRRAAAAMPEAEIEIVEQHHDRKLDAPSGTALALVDAIREQRPEVYARAGRSGHAERQRVEIGIHSIRMGDAVGTHEVLFCAGGQTVALRHEAHSRAVFADGALAAAAFLQGKEPGLYDMRSLIAL